ncbi:hypothetical protein H2248_008164 [Termitomyces sp. 'cryptogamus']|nr:hypothetical protein H2248_008164 [Termitomyces sp. 'cryptogamus']
MSDVDEPSSSFRPWFLRPRFSASSRVDPFAIIEASLTSVKYALYHVVGSSVLRSVCPCNLPANSLLTSALSGFIGGALFTIPFLVFLRQGDDVTCTESFPFQFSLVGAEFFYSMIGGGAGILALGDQSYIGIALGMFRGLIGPLVVFTILYLLLTIVLAIISFVY